MPSHACGVLAEMYSWVPARVACSSSGASHTGEPYPNLWMRYCVGTRALCLVDDAIVYVCVCILCECFLSSAICSCRLEFTFDRALATLEFVTLLEIGRFHITSVASHSGPGAGARRVAKVAPVARIEPLSEAILVLCDGAMCAYSRSTLDYMGNLTPLLPGDLSTAPVHVDCMTVLGDITRVSGCQLLVAVQR